MTIEELKANLFRLTQSLKALTALTAINPAVYESRMIVVTEQVKTMKQIICQRGNYASR
jgi:hypothetical protein